LIDALGDGAAMELLAIDTSFLPPERKSSGLGRLFRISGRVGRATFAGAEAAGF
jgi:hypothetical protein